MRTRVAVDLTFDCIRRKFDDSCAAFKDAVRVSREALGDC
jgi:hypothetical protein